MTLGRKIEQYILSEKFLGQVSSWLLILVLAGFNLVALIAVIFKVDSTPLSMAYRAIYLLIALFLLSIYILQKRKFTLSLGNYFFIVFWLIYIARLIYDLSIVHVTLVEHLSVSYYYMYAIGGCFIPAFAIACTGKYIDKQFLIKNFFYFLLINHILLLVYMMIRFGGQNIFLRRVILTSISDDKRTLGPLMISLNGSMLFVISILNISLGEFYKICKKNVAIIGAILGFIGVLLGASRGPFVFSILIMLFIFWYNYQFAQKTATYLFKYFAIFLLLVFVVAFVIIPNVDWEQINMVERILLVTQETREEARVSYYAVGWNDFITHPIVGRHFLTFTHGLDKPGGPVHNIFLEALQATGLVGSVFFYGMVVSLFRRLHINSIRFSINIYIVVLTFVVLGFAMTSGAIYTDPFFWCLVTFVLTFSKSKSL